VWLRRSAGRPGRPGQCHRLSVRRGTLSAVSATSGWNPEVRLHRSLNAEAGPEVYAH
jgi:hypothetical protein